MSTDRSTDERLAEAREAARKWAFRPGEREAIAAELAERQARIKRDETLAWAEQQIETRDAASRLDADEKGIHTMDTPGGAQEMPQQDRSATMTNDWATWVRREIRTSQRKQRDAILGGVGDVMAEQRAAHKKTVDELRREIETLRATVADLTARLDRLEQIERSSVPPFMRAV